MDFYIPRQAVWLGAAALTLFAIWPRVVYDEEGQAAYNGRLFLGMLAMVAAVVIVSRYLAPAGSTTIPLRASGWRMVPVFLLWVLATICLLLSVSPIQLQSISDNQGSGYYFLLHLVPFALGCTFAWGSRRVRRIPKRVAPA